MNPNQSKYKLSEFCVIDCIKIIGTIIEINETVFGTQYTVRYFGSGGEPMKERFFPHELSGTDQKQALGFMKG